MPSYLFEVTTATDIERYPFTVDHDRPLGPQVTQVLEELQQRGVMLRGGHSDVLGVYWMGRELDVSKRPGELAISPARPIELRMREASVAAVAAHNGLPRGVLASAMFGYVGGVVAWLVAALASLPSHFTTDYNRLDQITMALLGAIAGACVLAGLALRGRGVVLLAIVSGMALGGLGSLIGASASLLIPGSSSVRGFVVARVAGWALSAAIGSALLACYSRHLDPRRLAESLFVGLLGGGACGVIFALPGPSDLWQGLAFAAFGVTTGMAVAGPALWRAAAIVELVPSRGLVPEILTLREWPVYDGSTVEFGAAKIGCQDQRVALYPAPEGALFQGRRFREPVFLEAGGELVVSGTRYRVRILRAEA